MNPLCCLNVAIRCRIFISSGFYKPDPVKEYDEESPGGNFDFLSRLCTEWEAAAKLPKDIGVRQVILRCGEFCALLSRISLVLCAV